MDVYTAQFNSSKSDRLDITAKSKDPLGKIFKPTWEIVLVYKNKEITELEYTKKYHALMKTSYMNHLDKWKELLNRDTVTLVYFCRSGDFCHRILLAKILARLGAKYHGER
ncbi:MAG: DUF488 family protein [Bacilli bacterium]